MSPSRKKLIVYCVLLALLVLTAFQFLSGKDTDRSVTYTRTLMGTVVQITVTDNGQEITDRAVDRAYSEIKRLERLMSSYDAESDVSRVCASAGSFVKVSPEVIDVVEKALQAASLSDGAFDPTIGALARLWGYSGEKGAVPDRSEVDKALRFVNYRAVTVDRAASSVRLDKKGMVLNLGGIAKGYITDKAMRVLEDAGVERAIIHAGGDMTVYQKTEESPFKIGIQDPREKRLLGEAYVTNGYVSTSGDYERYFIKDGVRYHHILDPKTGFPASGSRSVTIIAKDPSMADALSTAVFVMGPEKGMALVERLGDVEGVIVDSNGKTHVSKGFKGRIN